MTAAATILRRIAHARRLRRDLAAHRANQPLRHRLGSDHRPRRLTVDPRPGRYYVTATSGGRVAFILGPFRRHQQARRWVRAAQREGERRDPFARFHRWGTARLADDWAGEPPRGTLNNALGMASPATKEH